MSESLSGSFESSLNLSAHISALQSCCESLVSTLSLSWEQVRSYAHSVLQSFGTSSGEDFLLVDYILKLLKKMIHHVRHIYQAMISNAGFLDHHGLVRVSQSIKDSMESLMHASRFVHQTFGWLIEEILGLVDAIKERAHV